MLGNFADHATAVFSAKNVEDKRAEAFKMIDAMRSSEVKKASFRLQAVKMSPRQLDKFAADCFLVDTDKVIK